MSTAGVMARAILQASSQLPADLQRLLTPERAWTLGILLASWRKQPGRGDSLDLTGLSDVTGSFDRYADTLLRFRRAATEAQDNDDDALKLAAASGYFIAAVNRIGTDLLGHVIASERFGSIQKQALTQFPLPAELRGAAETKSTAIFPSESRAKRYLGFDNRPKGQPQASADLPPSATEIARWQEELQNPALSAEMRWLMEQKLLAAKLPAYQTKAQAHEMWKAAAQNASNLTLRDYFNENLALTDSEA
jgi:hypothetical protein